MVWREGSAVRSTSCSSRRPTSSGLQPPETPGPENPTPSGIVVSWSTYTCMPFTQTHICTDTNKSFIFFKVSQLRLLWAWKHGGGGRPGWLTLLIPVLQIPSGSHPRLNNHQYFLIHATLQWTPKIMVKNTKTTKCLGHFQPVSCIMGCFMCIIA